LKVFELERDGFERCEGLLSESKLAALEALLPPLPSEVGVRLFDNPELHDWIFNSAIGVAVRSVLGAAVLPVRAIFLDKSAEANWSLGWHQDRTIAVRSRADCHGFENWNSKGGVPHVEPPFCFIERMLTARIHLDPVGASNSPLLVAPGSHRLGRVREALISDAVERCGTMVCMANRGDVWLYRTAILHASEPSRSQARRRVLQIDFASTSLPAELDWRGVA